MQAVIDSLSHGVPAALSEVRKLGRTLKRRAADVLVYFDSPGTSNGPTEAINGRLEHLRGSALGFRNFTNYIARSLLEAGGFRPRLHPQFWRARLSRAHFAPTKAGRLKNPLRRRPRGSGSAMVTSRRRIRYW
jgi:hypothetical protein